MKYKKSLIKTNLGIIININSIMNFIQLGKNKILTNEAKEP